MLRLGVSAATSLTWVSPRFSIDVAGDRGHRDRHVLQSFLALAGDDDDLGARLLAVGALIGCLRRGTAGVVGGRFLREGGGGEGKQARGGEQGQSAKHEGILSNGASRLDWSR